MQYLKCLIVYLFLMGCFFAQRGYALQPTHELLFKNWQLNGDVKISSQGLYVSSGFAVHNIRKLKPNTQYQIKIKKTLDVGSAELVVFQHGNNLKKKRLHELGSGEVTLDFTTGLMSQTASVKIQAKSSHLTIKDFSITEVGGSNYYLIWADEFNGQGMVDVKKWGFERGFARGKELQWYQPDNAFMENGLLVIEGRKERFANPLYLPGSKKWKTARQFVEYTSSSLTTEDLFDFQYGKLAVRAKVSNKTGTFPAIWTLGVECSWPANGEVDIMENYQGDILANFAWGTDLRKKPKWDSIKVPVSQMEQRWAEKFHLWEMDWDSHYMSIYLDGQLINELDLTKSINGADNCEGQNPFRQPHFILLNLALGSHGGSVANLEFPTRYLIDYVRVYKNKNAVPKKRATRPYYQIVQKTTGKKVSVCDGDDGARVHVVGKVTDDQCMQWEKIPYKAHFHIRHKKHKKHLKPESKANGSKIVIQPKSWTGDWTQWEFKSTEDGFGLIINKATGKLLYYNNKASSSLLEQYPTSWSDSDSQWKFVQEN